MTQTNHKLFTEMNTMILRFDQQKTSQLKKLLIIFSLHLRT